MYFCAKSRSRITRLAAIWWLAFAFAAWDASGAVTNGYICAVLRSYCQSAPVPPAAVGSIEVGAEYVIMTVADADPEDAANARQLVADSIFQTLMPLYCNLPRSPTNCVENRVQWDIVTYNTNGNLRIGTSPLSGSDDHYCAGYESGPPAIYTQQDDSSVNSGQTARFGVTVSGAVPFSYQWVFNGTNALAGETNATLILHGANTNHAGTYQLWVTNSLGYTNSREAMLFVDPGPAATNGYITAVLWSWNLPAFPPPVGGIRLGSNYVIMTVADANPINLQQAQTLVSDSVFQSIMPFYCNLSRSGPCAAGNTVQWNIVTYDTNGEYRYHTCAASGCQYRSCYGFETGPPTVNVQPADLSLNSGETARFSVDVSGSVPLTFQWFFNGTNVLADATNSTLVLADIRTSNTGAYEVRVSNSLGTTNSHQAFLLVDPGPAATNGYITAVLRCGNIPTHPPAVGTTMAGTNYVIRTVADADPLNLAQAKQLVTDAVFKSLMPLYCRLWNTNAGCGDSVAWEVITYAANGEERARGCAASGCGFHSCFPFASDLPVIVEQPFDLSIKSGQSATFGVEADGANPLSYQWVFNGTHLLAGETNSTLVLPAVDISEAGTYQVAISNAFGSTNSIPARLIIDAGPKAALGYITAILRSGCASAPTTPPPLGEMRVGANYVIVTVADADPDNFGRAQSFAADSTYRFMMPLYCAQRSPANKCVGDSVQWGILTYDTNGQNRVSGCAASGCQLHACAEVQPPISTPSLAISTMTNKVGVSWSMMYSDFQLEESTNMVDWYPATGQTVTNLGTISMPDNSPPARMRFYRLKHK